MLRFFLMSLSTFKIIAVGAIIFWDVGKRNKKNFQLNCKTEKTELVGVA